MNKIKNKLQSFKNIEENRLTYFKLITFFIPLGTSTLLITISNLLLNRCMGYIPDSDFYISSFSVARTLMQLFLSPVSIMALIFTAFTQNIATFKKVSRYALYSVIILQSWFVLLAFSPISRFILSHMYNLDGALLENAVFSLKTICILPVFFFVREYFLGVAIKLRNVRFAALGSLLRFTLILLASFSMPSILIKVRHDLIPGLLLGSMVFLESIVYMLGVLLITKGKVLTNIVLSLKRQNSYSEESSLSYKKILNFTVPLLLSYSMAQLIPSFSQSALALGENKQVILTVYAVVLSLLNIIGAFSFQIPQLVVNHDTFNPNNNNITRKFCIILAGFMFLLSLIVTFTGLGDYLVLNLMKVSPQNLSVAKVAFMYGLLYPTSMVFMSYKRGKLIKIKKTGLLVFERVSGTLITLLLFLIVPAISWKHGAGAGILMLTAANFATGIFLDVIFRISVKKNPQLINHTLL